MGIELNNLNIYFDACSAKDGAKNVGNSAGYAEHLTDNYLKRCLKSKILEKRQKLGLGKIDVDFTPKKEYPMTEEEKEKDRKRRQSNRRSAHKSRQKQKEENERNESLLQQLKEEQGRLLMRCNEIETERNKYKNALNQVLPGSKICEACREIDQNSINTCENNNGLIEDEFVQYEAEPEILPNVASTDTLSSESGTIGGDNQQFPYGLDTFMDSEKYIAGGNYIAEYIEVMETENVMNGENLIFQTDKNCEVDMPVTNVLSTDGNILYTTDYIDTSL